MYKHVLSALTISGLLLSGAAFAAEPSTPAGQSAAPAQTMSSGPTAKSTTATKEQSASVDTHHKATHKRTVSHKAAAKGSKTDAAAPAASAPAKSN